MLANVSHAYWARIWCGNTGTTLDNQVATSFEDALSLVVATPCRKFAVGKNDGIAFLQALSTYWETRV